MKRKVTAYCLDASNAQKIHSKWNLIHHNKEKHNVDKQLVYNCEACDFHTSNKNSLKAHINLRHSKKNLNSTFSCDICDEDFETKSHLASHMKEDHTEKLPYTCSECEKQFKDSWNMKNHKRDNHEVTEICQHFLRNSCKFQIGECWSKHKKK